MWKRIEHPNIVPFIGISETPPLEIVYDWMEHGKITEYVRGHPGADRIGLVSEFVLLLSSCSNAEYYSCGT